MVMDRPTEPERAYTLEDIRKIRDYDRRKPRIREAALRSSFRVKLYRELVDLMSEYPEVFEEDIREIEEERIPRYLPGTEAK